MHFQHRICRNKRPERLILEAIEKNSKTFRFHVLPPFEKSPIKTFRFCVLPPLKNHPSKPFGFMYSPLWKITHQKPSVLCTPPFEKYNISHMNENFLSYFTGEGASQRMPVSHDFSFDQNWPGKVSSRTVPLGHLRSCMSIKITKRLVVLLVHLYTV